MESRNGNYADFDLSTWFLDDTLGRSVTWSSGTISSSEYYTQYTIHDSGGTARDYRLIWKNYSVHNPVENSSDSLGLLENINLPNGRHYEFIYGHDQGFLTKVILPSGGYVEFDYANGNTSHDLADDYVVERRVSADASTTVRWTYARSTSGSNRVITETDPQGGDSTTANDFVVVHTFDTNGYEIQTVWKNNSTADPSKTVDITRVCCEGQPDTIVTTMDELQQQQTFSWSGTFLNYSTQSDWYAANTSPALLTKRVYSYASSWPYFTTQVELQAWDGSSYVTQGKTQFYYDQYSVSSVTGSVPHHHSPINSSRSNLTTVRRYSDASNYVEEHFHYDELGNVIEYVDARGIRFAGDVRVRQRACRKPSRPRRALHL